MTLLLIEFYRLISVDTTVPGPLIALLMIGVFVAFIGIFVYAPCISMNVICIGIFCSGPVSASLGEISPALLSTSWLQLPCL